MTTKQAAEKLGVSPGRVRQLVAEGRLTVRKIGRDNFIDKADLERFEKEWDRTPGRRPAKN